MTQSMWLPNLGGWVTGWEQKDCCNCLWSLESWVACRRRRLLWCRNYRHMFCTAGCVNFPSIVDLFTCPLSHAVTLMWCWPSFTVCERYCIWQWSSLTEESTAGDGTDFHTQALPSTAAGPSYLLLAISLSRKQPWNLKSCTLSLPWPLQTGLFSGLFDVIVRDVLSHVWTLFCTYRTEM